MNLVLKVNFIDNDEQKILYQILLGFYNIYKCVKVLFNICFVFKIIF